MGLLEWWRAGRSRREAKRQFSDDGVLFAVAKAKAEELQKARKLRVDAGHSVPGHDDEGLQQLEALLGSGVTEARSAAVAPHVASLNDLAEQHRRHGDAAQAAAENVELLQSREMVVTVATPKRTKRHETFAQSPDLSGDTRPVPALRSEHEALSSRIDQDLKRGQGGRHRSGVLRWMKIAAFLLVFVDVLAIAMILIPVENTTLDPEAYADGGWIIQLPRLLTAFALSALVAGAIAVWSHLVGEMTWAAINTPAFEPDGGATTSASENPDEETSQDVSAQSSELPVVERLKSVVVAHPVLALGWVGVLGMSVLTGVTMCARLGHAVTNAVGVGTAAGVCLAALIGAMAAAAPVCVAVVNSRGPSPEVLRRNALAQAIAEIDRQVESAHQKYTAETLAMESVLDKAYRKFLDAEDADRRAALPAAQAILRLRTEYGYAGDQYSVLQVAPRIDATLLPEEGEPQDPAKQDPVERVRSRILGGVPLFDTEALARCRHVIEQMAARKVTDLDAKKPHQPAQPETEAEAQSESEGEGAAAPEVDGMLAPDSPAIPDLDGHNSDRTYHGDGDRGVDEADLPDRVIHAV
ncbi:hypothetical protein [Rhodococcoides kyotonense]|uniref:Uncharacterized protein n=1 Tax=Rhodococcoides kyotonense TaxID=398843 RepID=A0A177YBT2_9NOCA|nr:hypothetical protein [Rhodococcus kyotonensis]OAK52983.1 hypothetical protein A3K89_24215 [Rhodococcus kyotonensis]